jgi:hypothetical protein
MTTETVGPDRQSVAMPVSTAIQKASTVSASALAQHLDCSRQKRPRNIVSALRSIAVAESAKNQLLRDFRRRSIFDFCNTACQYRTHLPAANSIMSRLSRTIDLLDFN